MPFFKLVETKQKQEREGRMDSGEEQSLQTRSEFAALGNARNAKIQMRGLEHSRLSDLKLRFSTLEALKAEPPIDTKMLHFPRVRGNSLESWQNTSKSRG
jgi:hypothetical protein